MPASAQPPPSASARQADRFSATLLFLFSIVVMFEARALPYWTVTAPGPGFVPFWLGALLGCGSVVMFVRTLGKATAVTDSSTPETPWRPDRATTRRVAIVVALTASAAALTFITGLVLASGMFMGATLAYLRPGHGRANLVATLLTPILVWLVFARWLGVPLPGGFVGF